MDDLPPQPTPQQSYLQLQHHSSQSSHHSHHNNVNRKYPQQAQQNQYKVSYRPPPQQQQQAQPQQASPHYQQQQVQPQQQYQQYNQPPQQEYYQQAPGHSRVPPQGGYQQPYQNIPPQQQYSNAPPPPSMQYQQRPSYSLPPPAQQQIYQQHAPSQPSQAPQYQQQTSNNGHYSKHNVSRDSLETTKTTATTSSKQKLEGELRSVFEKVDINGSGRISAKELSHALLNFDRSRFQDSTIRLMINLFCGPDSATKSLNFEQFVSLWKYLSAYKKLFIQADTNKSGDISFGEFQKILEQIGYKLDIDLVLNLFQKYALLESGGVGKLRFDNFIELLVYLRKLTDVFKKYDKDLSGTATISFSDFLFEVTNLT